MNKQLAEPAHPAGKGLRRRLYRDPGGITGVYVRKTEKIVRLNDRKRPWIWQNGTHDLPYLCVT